MIYVPSLSIGNYDWTFEGNHIFKTYLAYLLSYIYYLTHFVDRILFKDILKMLPVSIIPTSDKKSKSLRKKD